MTKWVGLLFVGVVAAACGHEVTTGSARNDWATPTGYASATHPRYINADAAAHKAHDRSVFAAAEAPTLQPMPVEVAPEPVGAVPPPAETMPPPATVPDETLPRDSDVPPSYVTPIRPVQPVP
ncbi:MAG TPA: hypothetical protein VGL86_23985 [Polyangia bacterium]